MILLPKLGNLMKTMQKLCKIVVLLIHNIEFCCLRPHI